MMFSDEDKILIKKFVSVEGILSDGVNEEIFKQMVDKKSSINRRLKKFGDTGAVNRLTDNG